MAIDEALLRSYALTASGPVLRVYSWKPYGLSLGYSQDVRRDLDIEECRSRAMPFVRRITGGGMLMHANELTYSLVCSGSDLGIPRRVASSYKAICSFLITFYNRLGLDAKFACDAVPGERLGRPSTLCMASKEKYDIVAGGRKLGGNAQKRSKDLIFQHGSIPIKHGAPKAAAFLRKGAGGAGESDGASLEELTGRKYDPSELSVVLADSFRKTFDIELLAGALSADEQSLSACLRTLKYESDDWNLCRIDRTVVKDRQDE